MSELELHAPFRSTSASGAMLLRQVREPLLLGCMLAGLGTSAGVLPHDVAPWWQLPHDQTTSGVAVAIGPSAGGALGELRRLSGFTWEQLARLFHVSRRALHFWASGKPMAKSNEEHLQRLLAVVRRVDRGSASATRGILLASCQGSVPFDLLTGGEYERVLALLGPGEGRNPSPKTKLSAEARAARTPRPPEEIVSSLEDRIHPTSGKLLRATPIVTSRRK